MAKSCMKIVDKDGKTIFCDKTLGEEIQHLKFKDLSVQVDIHNRFLGVLEAEKMLAEVVHYEAENSELFHRVCDYRLGLTRQPEKIINPPVEHAKETFIDIYEDLFVIAQDKHTFYSKINGYVACKRGREEGMIVEIDKKNDIFNLSGYFANGSTSTVIRENVFLTYQRKDILPLKVWYEDSKVKVKKLFDCNIQNLKLQIDYPFAAYNVKFEPTIGTVEKNNSTEKVVWKIDKLENKEEESLQLIFFNIKMEKENQDRIIDVKFTIDNYMDLAGIKVQRISAKDGDKPNAFVSSRLNVVSVLGADTSADMQATHTSNGGQYVRKFENETERKKTDDIQKQDELRHAIDLDISKNDALRHFDAEVQRLCSIDTSHPQIVNNTHQHIRRLKLHLCLKTSNASNKKEYVAPITYNSLKLENESINRNKPDHAFNRYLKTRLDGRNKLAKKDLAKKDLANCELRNVENYIMHPKIEKYGFVTERYLAGSQKKFLMYTDYFSNVYGTFSRFFDLIITSHADRQPSYFFDKNLEYRFHAHYRDLFWESIIAALEMPDFSYVKDFIAKINYGYEPEAFVPGSKPVFYHFKTENKLLTKNEDTAQNQIACYLKNLVNNLRALNIYEMDSIKSTSLKIYHHKSDGCVVVTLEPYSKLTVSLTTINDDKFSAFDTQIARKQLHDLIASILNKDCSKADETKRSYVIASKLVQLVFSKDNKSIFVVFIYKCFGEYQTDV